MHGINKSHGVKIRSKDLYLFLITALPVIDSLNGLINRGGNEGGLSMGILYRLFILLFSICLWRKSGMTKKAISLIFLISLVCLFSVIIDFEHINSYFIVLTKLLLPIVLIMSHERQIQKGELDFHFVDKIFRTWEWLFPVTIIIPFFLNSGFKTYGAGNAGYKGFYYAQNDISYILALLYLYIMYELLERVSIKKVIIAICILGSNLLLGLKSNYLFIIAITIFYVCGMNRKHKSRLSRPIVLAIIVASIATVFFVYANEIQFLFDRWLWFSKNNTAIAFWTSSRLDRILPAYSWLSEELGIGGFLFGSGLLYTFHIGLTSANYIEMDFFDLFFQIGAIGVVLIYGFYIQIQRKYKSKGFYFWGFMLSLAFSILAGHVMESALSGMAFAILCSGSIVEYYKRKCK